MRRWAPLGILILALGFLAFAILVYHSDYTVRERFMTARWVAPAQVYAAPLELYQGAPLSATQLASALDQLGYRALSVTPQQIGEYRRQGATLELVRRAFEWTDGAEPPRTLRVRHDASQVMALHAGDGSNLVLERLEPMRIGSLYPAQGEDREMLQLEDWPLLLREGLLAVEDQRFWRHVGLDPQGLLRAAWRNLRAGRVVEGGSTLTQQLVKNLFLSNTRSLPRKVREAVMALLLEWHFDKAAILEAYGNQVYLGQDGNRAIHGFGLGSQFWFGKPLSELQPAEIAMLVGMVKGPSAYHPLRRPEAARERRDLVLKVWHAAGLLDSTALALAESKPLGVVHNGRATKTRPAFMDLVRRELRRDFPAEQLTFDGLRIYTHLNPHLQALAEQAVRDGLAQLTATGPELQAALVATSPVDGRIQALVGSADPGQDGFNRAVDARRPIGSLVKPAIYYAALAQPARYTLITPLRDEPVQLRLPNGDLWAPENFDGEVAGPVPLYQALAQSLNLATVNLALDLGIPEIARTLSQFGVGESVPMVPALALGALSLSPLQVAGMYSHLAAGGYPSPLRAIAGVHTAEGEPLLRDELRLQRGLDPRTAALVQWALRQVLSEGTGRSAGRYFSAPRVLAGKTGTSDGQRDSWFAGYGSSLQATVWVGNDSNQSLRYTGASAALPIWARFMDAAQAAPLEDRLPRGVAMHPVDTQSVQPGGEGCHTLRDVPFIDGSLPDVRAPCAQKNAEPWYRRFW